VPIYEYLCHACSHRFEVKQSIKDQPIGSCVRCGAAVTKLISSPAIMFKGSGWYVTDYSDKLKPTGEAESGEKTAEKTANGKEAAPAATPAKEGASTESSTTAKDTSPAKAAPAATGATNTPSTSTSSSPGSGSSSS
jgi:putative FmdB family regulatory protein